MPCRRIRFTRLFWVESCEYEETLVHRGVIFSEFFRRTNAIRLHTAEQSFGGCCIATTRCRFASAIAATESYNNETRRRPWILDGCTKLSVSREKFELRPCRSKGSFTNKPFQMSMRLKLSSLDFCWLVRCTRQF